MPSPFTLPVFRRFWLARAGSSFAFQMQSVALGWQVYALTHSTWDLGMVGLCAFLPQMLLTLVVGHVADRFDRRRIASVCQAVEGLCALSLAVGSATGAVGFYGILVVAALLGGTRAFEFPAMSALLPSLLAPAVLPAALALSSSAITSAQIAGPALGGLLYAAGPAVVYAGCGALFFAASVASATIVAERRVLPAPAARGTVFVGIRYVRSKPAILGSLSLDLFAVLLGGATALLPVYARDILSVGTVGLGALRAAPAVGALLTSVVLSRLKLRRAGPAMFAAVGLFGAATIVFGVSRSMPLSLAALFVLGAADVVSVVVRSSLVQLQTPDAMRGRVSAVNALFIGTSNQLGEFESGVTASLLGTVPAVVLGGVGTIVVALVWMRLFPQLRRLDLLTGQEPAPTVPAPTVTLA